MSGVLVRRGKSEHTQVQNEDHEPRRGRAVTYKPMGEAWDRPFPVLRRHPPCRHPDLRLPAPRSE